MLRRIPWGVFPRWKNRRIVNDGASSYYRDMELFQKTGKVPVRMVWVLLIQMQYAPNKEVWGLLTETWCGISKGAWTYFTTERRLPERSVTFTYKDGVRSRSVLLIISERCCDSSHVGALLSSFVLYRFCGQPARFRLSETRWEGDNYLLPIYSCLLYWDILLTFLRGSFWSAHVASVTRLTGVFPLYSHIEAGA